MHFKTPRTGIWLLLCLVSLIVLTGCSQKALHSSAEVFQTTDYPELIIWPNSNSHSNNEVVIKLVVRAGSLQETDQQLGYAHLLEHMLFRGTERYPGDQLQRRLRELGLVLGTHSNAFTSFDETTYWFYLNTAETHRVEAVMEILAEMAFHAQVEASALAVEREVVLQEWRDYTRDQHRVDEVLFNDLFAGSRYAERRPIGTEASIRTATVEGLQSFYRQWYQAPNMTVVVSGDVDVAAVQSMFLTYFRQPFTAPLGQPEQYPLALDQINDRLIVTDPYTTSGSVWMGFIHPMTPVLTTEDWLGDIKRMAVYDILLDRLERRLVETQGRVSDFQYYFEHGFPGYYLMEFGASVTTGGAPLALELMEYERQRLLVEGISDTELARWVRRFLRHERLQQDSAWHLANEARLHATLGRPLLNQPEKLAVLEAALPQWSAQEVLRAAVPTLTRSPNIQVIHPYNVPAPTAVDVDAWLARGLYEGSSAVAGMSAQDNEFDEYWPIAPDYNGRLLAEHRVHDDVQVWTLDNGIEVLFRHQTGTPGKTYFAMVGLGGFNRMSAEETLVGRLVTDVMGYSGLRSLDGAELSQWLEGQGMALQATQDFYDRLLYGYASTEDFAVLMRILHSALTEAKADPFVWEHMLAQYQDHLTQWAASPHHLWTDVLSDVVYNQEPALRSFTLEELADISLDDLYQNYERYVAGAQNYRLVIVGDIDQETAYTTVMESIATLPGTDDVATPNRQYPQIMASHTAHVPGSGDQSAHITLRYSAPKDSLSSTFRQDQLYLTRWLDEILFDEIRDVQGMAYSIQSHFEGLTRFEDDLRLVISLAVDPDRVDESIQAIEALLTKPPSAVTQEQLNFWYLDYAQQRRHALQSSERVAFDLAYAELFQRDLSGLLTGESARTDAGAVMALLKQLRSPEAKRQELVWLP